MNSSRIKPSKVSESFLSPRPNLHFFSPWWLAHCLSSSTDSHVSSPQEACQYLTHLYAEHRLNPLLITFHLRVRTSNHHYSQLHLLSTHDNDLDRPSDRFSNLLMSLASTFSSTRQKQSVSISKWVLMIAYPNHRHFLSWCFYQMSSSSSC